MRFSQNLLEEIRARIPIADVVGRRVTFDRKKSNPSKGDFWGCCPFHGEKTPSFHCENSKGRYHCFGCGASGDHFRFMTELDGVSFPEAVERLAEEAGVPMPAVDPQAEARERKRASLYDVMTMAAEFFQQQLQTADGAKARAYLRDRGLAVGVQQAFGLGYAPQSRSALKEHLGARGVEKEKIEACGLVVFGPEIAVSYDRFRDRIMFPILDARERVIAFGGRALSADVPAKYLNSPETDLFSKSNVLYNYARARKATGKDGSLIVCEGYMDVIALAAAGFGNAVAPLGTALTENQLELAWRVGGEPVLCFDGDGAGLRAANRSIDTALAGLKPGRSLRFALLPEGEDPDDLIKRAGPSAFGDVLAAARPLAAMLWNRETSGQTFDTPERRAQLERTLFGVVSAIVDENVKRHYQQDVKDRLAGFFGTPERKGSGKGDGRGGDRKGRGQGGAAYGRGGAGQSRLALSESLMNSSLVRRSSTRPSLREAALLVTVINHPMVGAAHFDAFAELDLIHPVARKLHAGLLDIMADFGAESGADGQPTGLPNLEAIQARLEECGLGKEMRELDEHVRHNRLWQALPDAAFEDAADGWLQSLALYQRSRTLNTELKLAETAFAELGDEASYRRLVSIQAEIANSDGTEALIDGFGVSSGRPLRNF
ncbi:MAG: DNA primase [Pseudomonadota bacterium]